MSLSDGFDDSFDVRRLDSENFYTRLGLEQGNATDDAVHQAYRTLSAVCRRTETKLWQDRAQRLNEAHKALFNRRGRESYDRQHPTGYVPPLPKRRKVDYSDSEGYRDERVIFAGMVQEEAEELLLGLRIHEQNEKFYIAVTDSSGLPLDPASLSPRYRTRRDYTKRGVEFWLFPYRTDRPYRQGPPDRTLGIPYHVGATIFNGRPLLNISASTKRELKTQVRQLAARGVQNPWKTEAEIDAVATTDETEQNCWNCAGKHPTNRCFYNCHRCVTEGPWLTHRCDAQRRFSCLPKDLQRTLILHQRWPLWQHPSGRTEFTIRRVPYVYRISAEWSAVFRNICDDFNGRVFIVDSTQHQAWLARFREHAARGVQHIVLPIFVKMNYREWGLLSAGHALEMMDKIYLPALRSLHRQRYEGPRVRLVQRRFFEPQKGDGGRLLMTNMQLRVEVVMTIYDFEPTTNRVHALLSRCPIGTVFYIFEHGAFTIENGSVEVPRWKYRHELKSRGHPTTQEDGSRSIDLIWTNFAESGAGTIDFRRLKKLKLKKKLQDFKPIVEGMPLSPDDREAVLALFRTTAPSMLDEGSPKITAIRERVGRMGVDVDKFMDAVYDRSTTTVDGLYQKRVYVDLSAFEERHRGRLWALYEGSPAQFGYKSGVAQLQRRLVPLGLNVENFLQVAYYTMSCPYTGQVDIGTEHGLITYEWIQKIFNSYQATSANHLQEIIGGCVRHISESFIGGPPVGPDNIFSAELWTDNSPILDAWRPHSGETLHELRRATIRALLKPKLGNRPLTTMQMAVIRRMCTRRAVCVGGPPGSGKTTFGSASILLNLIMYGETALVLTETNPCADEFARTLSQMMSSLRDEFPERVRALETYFKQLHGASFVPILRHEASAVESAIDISDGSATSPPVTSNPNAVKGALIVVSTWGHARSVAIQSFRADSIYADEAARSPLLFPLAILMQRSLNTTLETSTMPRDDKGRGNFNPHVVQRIVLIGDHWQGLPRMFGESIMSKLVEWKSGHYLNLMTVFSMSGCDFLRFTEVFRTPHDSVQFTLDRFHNQHVGAYKDTEGTIVSVKDAPLDLQRRLGVDPPVFGQRLSCPDLVNILALEATSVEKFGITEASSDISETHLRHVLIRTGRQDDDCGAKSHSTLLHSQQNKWHRELIMRMVRALLCDGLIYSEGDKENGRRVQRKDIIIISPYRDQTNLIEEDLANDPLTRSEGSSQEIRCRTLDAIQYHTMATVQGLQAPITILDFVRHSPSSFLCGLDTWNFQSHHNEHYSVGLTRSQVTHITLAAEWTPNLDPQNKRLYEKTFHTWVNLPVHHNLANACLLPGDNIPLVNVSPGDVHVRQRVEQPFVDFTSDNLWYFWVLSAKLYDATRKKWRYSDGFHVARGVGCITKFPEEDFEDECDVPTCSCRISGANDEAEVDNLDPDMGGF